MRHLLTVVKSGIESPHEQMIWAEAMTVGDNKGWLINVTVTAKAWMFKFVGLPLFSFVFELLRAVQ